MVFQSTHCCANLNVEFTDRGSVVHGVKGSHLINTHRRHLKYPGHLIHDADAGEAMLALAEVEQGHHRGLLVLRGVPGDDLLDELLILRGKLERNFRIVIRRVTVLQVLSAAQLELNGREGLLTTNKASLRAGAVTLKDRH